MTIATTTTMPSARALPMFSRPRITSLEKVFEICSGTMGAPWLIRAAAVA